MVGEVPPALRRSKDGGGVGLPIAVGAACVWQVGGVVLLMHRHHTVAFFTTATSNPVAERHQALKRATGV